MANIEYDDEILVWALSEEAALAFFGYQGQGRPVRVAKERPETDREKEKYDPEAKLYAIGVVKGQSVEPYQEES